MGFSCGIVGLPNAGKSTLFNALASANIAETAGYPFTTIKPNVGIIPVPDKRLYELANLLRPEKVTPTTIEIRDIAGLVKGASKGEGLGNQFLAEIRPLALLLHVVRCFEGGNVGHTEGYPDPVRDLEIVNTELLLSDIELIERRLERARKEAKTGIREKKEKVEYLEGLLKEINNADPIMGIEWEKIESNYPESLFLDLPLLTKKPVIIVANMGYDEDKSRNLLKNLKEALKDRYPIIPVYAELEAELIGSSEEERKEWLEPLGTGGSGLDLLIKTGYSLIGLITFYTVVGTELRAWSIPSGSTALDAAEKIHTDMAKGFIKAEIISYKDLIETGSLQAAREKGLVHIEGKDYKVVDGDILTIKFRT